MRITYLMADIFIDLRQQDGAALHITHIVSHLAALGHDVRLLSLFRGRGARPALDATWVRGYTPRHDLLFPIAEFINSRQLAAGCRWPTDVVHERFSALNGAGVMISRRQGAPLVLEVNAPLFEEWSSQHPLGRFEQTTVARSTRRTLQHATKIIAVSNVLAALLVDRWGVDRRKLVVLPNAVDVARFATPSAEAASATRTRYGLGDEALCMFVGSLQPWHGVDLLVRAFAAVVNERPKTRLVILGQGSLSEHLHALARELNVVAQVSWLGAVPYAEVPALLAVADVCLLPYPPLTQPYFSPLKLFEYMAAGKAIVASAQGQIAEMLTDQNTALLVTPGNIDDLKQAILTLLDQPVLRQRLGRKAYDQVKDNTWEKYAATLTQIYETAIDAKLRVGVEYKHGKL